MVPSILIAEAEPALAASADLDLQPGIVSRIIADLGPWTDPMGHRPNEWHRR
jgi:hypothetical protein